MVALSYGTVTGTFLKTVIDSADLDSDPDAVPVTGKVVLRPDVPYFIVSGVTVFPQIITVTLVNGEIKDPSGNTGIRLVASDSPGINPIGFTYTVSYQFDGMTGPAASSFLLPGGSTIDLSTMVPVAGTTGIPSLTGPAGATGPAGPTGATGPGGAVGATGPAGATGPGGSVGATGPAGAVGDTGPAGAVGATGPAGAVGATGPVGPAGVADLSSIIGKGITVSELSSVKPMDSESTLPVVTHGPFTWNWRAKAWFGPAYPVRWKNGDHVGIPVGPWPDVGHATIQGSTSHGATPWESDQEVDDAPQYDFDDNGTGDKPAPSDGSGVIFLIQTTTGYPATPDVPPALDYDIRDYLGDLELLDPNPVPYAFDDGDGKDGDSYLTWQNKYWYKREAGAWMFLGSVASPSEQISLSSTSKGSPVLELFGGAGSGTDPTDADLLIAYSDEGVGDYPHAGFRVRPAGTPIFMGAEPTDDELKDGQFALWYQSDQTDPTGIGLKVKCKDQAGTVYSGSITLNGI